MARIDDIIIPSLFLREQGTAPAAPASAGDRTLYVDDGGILRWRDSAGVITPAAGIIPVVSDTEPSSPENDVSVWFDKSTSEVKVYIGDEWVVFGGEGGGGGGGGGALTYDFTGLATGSDVPTGWTSNKAANVDVLTLDGASAMRVEGRILVTNNEHCWWDEPGDAVADFDLVTRMASNVSAGVNLGGPAFRDDGTSGHYLYVRSGTAMRVGNQSNNNLHEFTPGLTIVDSEFFLVRINLSGGALKVRAWSEAGAEPGTWDLDTTITPIAAGNVGFMGINTGRFNWSSYIALSTDPETPAPLPA